jgi:GH43 family beta-xylosidase
MHFDRSFSAGLLLTAWLVSCESTTSGADSEHAGGAPSGGASASGTGGGAPTAGTGASGASGASGQPGAGGTSGSGGAQSAGSGGSAGTGGADDISELLAEFDVFWDFENEQDGKVAPLVGEAALALEGSSRGAGPSGEHLVLSGESSSARTSDPVLDTSKDFSVSAWVKLEALEGYDTFVAAQGEQVSAFYLQVRDNKRLSFATLPADTTSASACVAGAEIQPRPGEWYHVVVTENAATREQRIYVDGALSGKITCPGAPFAATAGITVGRGFYGAEEADFLNGAIDDLGLISRVLTPEEVLLLYRAGRPDQKNYLFAYFVEVTQGRGDGLRLAHSHDGLHWGAIGGGGKVFMPPSVGGGSFRDPHVMRGPDGIYHLVWTTSCVPWAEANCVQDRGFGHATSPDLVTWSEADYVTIDLEVEHVWAPETYYDAASGEYMIFWSSPLDQTQGSDPHNIYYVLTEDFETFSAPAVLYSQPGRNFIDATIRADSGGYLMVLKDEADGQKNLRVLRSMKLFGDGAWTSAPSAPITGNYAAEGPSFLERDGTLYVYFDKYGEGAYGALRASEGADLTAPSAWTDISSSVFFPGVRHGTPIEVPWDVYRAVALEAAR